MAAKRLLLLLAHAIEEFDQVRLLSELNYDVFSIGSYTNPSVPQDPKRPALPQVAYHPELEAACEAKRAGHDGQDSLATPVGPRPPIDWAKADLPEEIIDWADAIICHHFEHTWIAPQWDRIKHKRVIWRTVGQSVEHNERMMSPLRKEGLQIVRYSPKERNIPGYAGEDALIRFYKDENEWDGWIGSQQRVLNFTQNLFQREPYTNWKFWNEATQDLPAAAEGPGSEVIGGAGQCTLAMMQYLLQSSRAYLYTGTQPASYTLGLIEAMMVGIPVVSIGPSWMEVFPYGPLLFEGHEIARLWSNSPTAARNMLAALLKHEDYAREVSEAQRTMAVELFGKQKIAAEWKAFLG